MIPNDAKKHTSADCWNEIHFQRRTTHTHTNTITQDNLRADNIMEMRELRCRKMTHKSCARGKMQNTTVCMMDTNSCMMSGKNSYKYLSLLQDY